MNQQIPTASASPQSRSVFSILFASALCIICILVVSASLLYFHLKNWGLTEHYLATAVVLKLEKGEGLRQFSDKLATQGVVNSSWRFLIWSRIWSNYRRFQAGQYRFEGALTPHSVASTIEQGNIYRPVLAQVAVPEGINSHKIFERLAAQGIGTIDEALRLTSDAHWLSSQKIKAAGVEGYLFPATYSFYEIPSLKLALERMISNFWENLPQDYEANAKTRGLSLHQAVIFASLIEAETAQDDERAKVSEVIWRRLRLGMPLGIDAALIYGIPDYAGDITFRHLRDATNPYNTRIHHGLPPGPICSPTRSSLEAVLNPTDAGYLYYVLDPEAASRHAFSKNAAEHAKNVSKMLHYQGRADKTN